MFIVEVSPGLEEISTGVVLAGVTGVVAGVMDDVGACWIAYKKVAVVAPRPLLPEAVVTVGMVAVMRLKLEAVSVPEVLVIVRFTV